MKIAPDVERLMWLVAESADAQAVADFEARFPELRYELSKRIDMVRELKSSRRLGESSGHAPRFVPSAPGPSPFGRSKFILAFAALSVVAFGSFYATRLIANRQPVKPPPVESAVNTPLNPPEIQHGPLNPPAANVRPPTPVVQNPPPTSDPVMPRTDAPWDRPQVVRFERIKLHDALRAIASQSGLELEIAPGLPNLDIVTDYQGMTGLEILADMGPRFGFTAFHQGEGRVIVIPARDLGPEGQGDEPTANPRVGGMAPKDRGEPPQFDSTGR